MTLLPANGGKWQPGGSWIFILLVAEDAVVLDVVVVSAITDFRFYNALCVLMDGSTPSSYVRVRLSVLSCVNELWHFVASG